MRKIIILLLPSCILYFLVGGVLVWFNVFSLASFLNGSGIVGGLASVLGLISFLRPALTKSDIDSIEADSLKKLSEVTAELRALEDARVQTASQIDSLEEQKHQMELLVRKASMALFLKEQQAHHEKIILEHLQKKRGYSIKVD